MIKIKCPKCREGLSLDDGFRGGICRCFHCAAMITVPSEQGADPEELSVKRPAERWAGFSTGTATALLGSTTVFQTRSGLELELSDDDLESIPVAPRREPGRPIRLPRRRSIRRHRPTREPDPGPAIAMIALLMAGFLLILLVVSMRLASQ